MISFLSPWMLLGLCAATAPIILHLIRKRTADRVRWGAWMFLADSMRRKRRRLLVEDILLLVLRTLMLAVAALAFARPFLPELHLFGGRGVDKDVVLVFDTSASMRFTGANGKSVFENARAEAAELVKLSPRGTAFGIVLGDRSPRIVTPVPVSSKREVLDLIETLEPGCGTMDAPKSLAAAGEILAGGGNPAKEVVLFGDGQAYGWRADETAEWKRVERVYSHFDRRVPVVWRTLERPSNVRNAALAAVVPSRRLIGTDRPVRFSVTVVNAGSEAFSPGEAVMTVDGVEIARAPVGQILPGLARTFEFSHLFSEGGRRVCVTTITAPDDIATDSVVTNEIDVIESLPVLLVNGRAGASGYDRPTAFLEAALRPELKGTNAVFLVSPRTVDYQALENAETLQGMSVAVLCDVPALSPKALSNLSDWVAAGGGLLTLVGETSATAVTTNDVFATPATNWVAGLEDVRFEEAPVIGRVPIEETALTNGLDVIGRFSDGLPAIVARKFGFGTSMLSAFPFDANASMFPTRPSFVPFVHELVYSLSSTNSVAESPDVAWRAREGDLTPLTTEESDALAVHIDLGIARSSDDALAAVLGRSFGVEVWKPFAIVCLALLLLEILFCRRLDTERGGRVRSVYRFVLRSCAVLAIVWMLLHLCWQHDVTRDIHRRVAVFADRSSSMSIADVPSPDGSTNRLVRYEVATNLAADVERILAAKYDVEPFEFGDRSTDFAAALEEALERIPSEELAGAVFVTDGRSTVDHSPEAAARRFARLGAKISSFVVGSVEPRVDASIETVFAAENVFLGDKVRALARLHVTGLSARRVVVRFMEDDEEIERREVEVAGDDWTEDVRFVHDPKGKGVRKYRIELLPVEGDVESANDVWPFDVSVSDDRTNVLLVDRRPRWEFRYLRNLFFGRDKSVHLQYVLTEPDELADSIAPEPPEADATRPFGEAEAGRLPRTRDDLRKFDVIILGDLSPATLSEQVQEDLRYCVEERGAMLIAIAGPHHMPFDYATGPLGRILPVSFTNDLGQVNAGWLDVTTFFELSPSGLRHPAVSLAGSSSENERIWSSLNPARGHLDGIVAKPGAEVLLFAGGSTALASPLMTIRETGRGKVVFLATDEMWRLRYRKGDLYHHRFWGNVLRWGAGDKLRDGDLHARAGTDALHYLPHDEVRIMARFSNEDFLPAADARPEAEVVFPNGRRRMLELPQREGVNGFYECLFDDTEAEGRYEVSIRSRVTPEPIVTSFNVDRGLSPVEFAQLTADREIPELMTGLTGGSIVDPQSVDPLADAFGEGKSEVTEHVETPLWNSPIAFLVFAAALVLVWVSRKRGGLQ